MGALALGLGWLAVSLIVVAVSAAHLQPMRDQAGQIADGAARRRGLARLDAAFAALIASLVAAFGYLLFGVLAPAVIAWGERLVVGSLIAVPILALGAMMTGGRLVPDRIEPSWRAYGGYLLRVAVLWGCLVILPVALRHFGTPGWVYPLALYLGVLASLWGAYGKSRRAAETAGAAS